MQEQYKEQFLYLSLHDTVHKLVAKNLGKMAEQLRKEFKFPDKRWVKGFNPPPPPSNNIPKFPSQ